MVLYSQYLWYSTDTYWFFITIITVDHHGDLMNSGDYGSLVAQCNMNINVKKFQSAQHVSGNYFAHLQER